MPVKTDRYIERNLKIKTKEGKLESFSINAPQRRLYEAIKTQAQEGNPIRIIILKARQMGFSTFTGGVIFKNCATKFHRKASIVAHNAASTSALLEMYKRFWDNLPQELRPARKKSNANELVLNTADNTGLDSQIRCYTAGAADIGRGETFQYLHASEYAFWGAGKEDTLLGLLQTVPKTPDSIVIIESTANGFDDFRERWYAAVRGESDYVPLFVGWHELAEYRLPSDGTPVTYEEAEIMRAYGLDQAQIQWRRATLRNECGGDINKFKQEYPLTPDEAFIATGDTYFDKSVLVARITEIERAGLRPKIGEFEFRRTESERIDEASIKFVECEKGIVRIYVEPEARVPYVAGGDTAGEGSDRSVIQVLDNRDGTQVAVLSGRMDEDKYCDQAYCMGLYYNRALMAIENNFNAYHNKRLQALGYPNLWLRRVEDRITRKIVEQYGFRTTSATRPQILAELRVKLRDEAEAMCDIATLREGLVFIVNDRGRPEAASGEHDDHIMALAIAEHIRGDQASAVRETPEAAQKKLIQRRDIRRIASM